mmetsp:Transcript_35615/g.91579  ORF Transcript_35615/g.91579 Transcript_35615/m.91579 type:complete len:210 (-) Transcript_35615:64-693(-)
MLAPSSMGESTLMRKSSGVWLRAYEATMSRSLVVLMHAISAPPLSRKSSFTTRFFMPRQRYCVWNFLPAMLFARSFFSACEIRSVVKASGCGLIRHRSGPLIRRNVDDVYSRSAPTSACVRSALTAGGSCAKRSSVHPSWLVSRCASLPEPSLDVTFLSCAFSFITYSQFQRTSAANSSHVSVSRINTAHEFWLRSCSSSAASTRRFSL